MATDVSVRDVYVFEAGLAEGRSECPQQVRAARFVAEHWRDAFMALDGPARVGCHPLAMVLAALDGETDPVQLGISEDQHAAFRAVLRE